MNVSPFYLSPEGAATVKAAASDLGVILAARRALRENGPDLTLPQVERRSSERRSVDRRGAVTVEIDGAVVIQPRTDWTESRWARLDGSL